MSPDPERHLLDVLFSLLNRDGIKYAVMRNYEPLPYSVDGSDLDLIVSSDDAARVKAVVLEAIEISAGVSIGIIETVGFFKISALGRVPASPGLWWGLSIDVFVGLVFKGNSLLSGDVPLPICKHRNIAVLTKDFAGVLGVLKELLQNGVISFRYAQAAQSAAQNDWHGIAKLLAPMGQPALDKFHKLLLHDSLLDSNRAACLSLRRSVMWHFFSQQPVLFLSRRLRDEWTKVRRYLKPSSVMVTILGVDGAGKSTLINAILPVLNAATHNAVIIQHLRPGLLPPLARLKGKPDTPVGPVVEPHGSTPSGALTSLLRLTYLTLDYVFGYWLWLRPRIAKKPTVVLFDRYAYDMALDPRRFRVSLPSRVAWWFAALAPKPDLIICLHGDPEIIAARKHELSVDETRLQVETLRSFGRNNPRAVLVSTDTNIGDSRNQVLQALFYYLSSR